MHKNGRYGENREKRECEGVMSAIGTNDTQTQGMTLVVLSCVLGSREQIRTALEKTEDAYLTNPERTLFAVVGDLLLSDGRITREDRAKICEAENRVRALCQRYGDRFALFVRDGTGDDGARARLSALRRLLDGERDVFLHTWHRNLPLFAVRTVVCINESLFLHAGAVRALAAEAEREQVLLRPAIRDEKGRNESLSPFVCGAFARGCPLDRFRETDAVTLLHDPERSAAAYYVRASQRPRDAAELLPVVLLALILLGGLLGELFALAAWTVSLFVCVLCRRVTVTGMAYEAYLAVCRLFPMRVSGAAPKRSLDDYLLRFSPSAMIGLVFFLIPTVTTRLLALLWIAMPFLSRFCERNRERTLCARDRDELLSYARDAWEGLCRSVGERGVPPNEQSVSPRAYMGENTDPETMGFYLLSTLCARELGMIDSRTLFDRCRAAARTIDSLYKWNGCPFSSYRLETLAPVGDLIRTSSCGLFACALTAVCEGLCAYVCEEPRLAEVIGDLRRTLSEMDFSGLFDEELQCFRTGYRTARAAFDDGAHTCADESWLAAYFAHAKGNTPFPDWKSLALRPEDALLLSLFLPMENGLPSERLRRLTRYGRIRAGRRMVFGRAKGAAFAFDGEMRYRNAEAGDRSVVSYVSFLIATHAPDEAAENLRRLRALGLYGVFGFYDALDCEPSRVGRGYAVTQCYRFFHVGVSIAAMTSALSNGFIRRLFLKAPEMRAFRYLLFRPFSVSRRRFHNRTSVGGGAPRAEETVRPSYTLTHPDAAMLTNHKTKLIVSSSGHILTDNGGWFPSALSGDLYSLRDCLRVYVCIDGVVLPTVPLGARTEGFFSEFSFEPYPHVIRYRSRHMGAGRTYGVVLTLSVLPDREVCEYAVSVTGEFKEAFAFLYWEPKGDRYASFASENGLILEEEKPFGRGEKTGITVTPCRERSFFETEGVGLLPNALTERDVASLAVREAFSDGVGRLLAPVCAVRSESVGARGGNIVFRIGFSQDTDELCYLLRAAAREGGRSRKRKQGSLAALQYASAGLCRPISSLERYLLRAILFGEIRPRTELTHRFDRSVLLRFALTEGVPLVMAVNADASVSSGIAELLGLFRYMRIRGVRFDLMLLCRTEEAERAVWAQILGAGCEELCVRVERESGLSACERFALDIVATVVFDLRFPLRENADKNPRAVPIREELLTTLAMAPSDSIAVGALPRQHALVSSVFGTVLTEHSLGFTYARDARCGRLTPHTAHGMHEDEGERLFLRVYYGRDRRDYDLCALARETEYGFGYAVYRGDAQGIGFRVSVCLAPRLGVKLISVSLRCTEKRRCTVFYAVRPAIGESERSARCYRYLRERNGIRILRFPDDGAELREAIVFSPDASTQYTERAALISDGAIFRGEADAAILGIPFTLCTERTVRFCLAAAFSEAHARLICRVCETEPLLPSTASEVRAWERLPLCMKLKEVFFAPLSGGECVLIRLMEESLVLLPMVPQAVKLAILRAAAHQYEEGDLQSRWYPTGGGVRAAERRDAEAFLRVVSRYLGVTGDVALLGASVSYLSSPPLDARERERAETPAKTNYRESLSAHLARARALLGMTEAFRGDESLQGKKITAPFEAV